MEPLRLHRQQGRHQVAAQRLRRIGSAGGSAAADAARRILRILIDGLLECHARRRRTGLLGRRAGLRRRRREYALAALVVVDG
jgi:hypothetical protein